MTSDTTPPRVALVTSGIGGRGETLSTRMAEAGYRVVVTFSPDHARHDEWLAGMKQRGFDILAVPCTVTDFDSCTQAVSEVQIPWGAQ